VLLEQRDLDREQAARLERAGDRAIRAGDDEILEEQAGLLVQGHLRQQVLDARRDRVSGILVEIERAVLVEVPEREARDPQRVGGWADLRARGANGRGPVPDEPSGEAEPTKDQQGERDAGELQYPFHGCVGPATSGQRAIKMKMRLMHASGRCRFHPTFP